MRSQDETRWKRSIDLNDVYYSKMRQYRLPSEVTPTNYSLDIKLVDENKFHGRVKINLTWSDTSDRITLNIHPDLEVASTTARLIQLSPEEA